MEILSHLRTVSEPEWLGDRYGGGTKETEEGAEVGRSGFTSCLPLMTQCSAAAAAAAKSLQSCPTLCDPIDGCAFNFLSCVLSCVRPSATTWTVAFQASLSMGVSRPEYWSGSPVPCQV